MEALQIPSSSELREFYPISASITDDKKKELFNYVTNILFVEMFGFEIANKIKNGSISEGSSDKFIGFQKFTALCCAYQEIKDPLVSTNFGAKIIDRQGSINPSNNQKSITLISIEQAISSHYKIAYALVRDLGCSEVPNWGGYFSYKISRL
jgi:hypothetical protein